MGTTLTPSTTTSTAMMDVGTWPTRLSELPTFITACLTIVLTTCALTSRKCGLTTFTSTASSSSTPVSSTFISTNTDITSVALNAPKCGSSLTTGSFPPCTTKPFTSEITSLQELLSYGVTSVWSPFRSLRSSRTLPALLHLFWRKNSIYTSLLSIPKQRKTKNKLKKTCLGKLKVSYIYRNVIFVVFWMVLHKSTLTNFL